MTDYLEKIKKLSNSLGAVGQPVDDEDLFHHTTRGLPAEYDSIRASIRISSSSFNEVQSLLLSEEIILEERKQPTLSTDSSLTAMVASRNPTNSSGRGSGCGGPAEYGYFLGIGFSGCMVAYPMFRYASTHHSASICNNPEPLTTNPANLY
ncbi:hypothetical protein MRB53_013724 [Persea americana]|uniref:Uncharacterized protein n=1 Tax=Persea americana TaxID=3435 RepID=A0ACC2K924_PERAE|nr:hypothetical protein MRB53_013724 [Persea americana]